MAAINPETSFETALVRSHLYVGATVAQFGESAANERFPLSVTAAAGEGSGWLRFTTLKADTVQEGWQISSQGGGLNVVEAGGGPAAGAESSRLFLQAGGNIGIGTTTPTHTLEVNGTLNATEILKNGAPLTSSQWENVSGGINYAGGNVGIGTAAPQGRLDVRGDIRAGNSDIYFTATDHRHTGIGNAAGLAAIENDGGTYNALMILGRTVSTNPLRRVVKLWDYLEVNGNAFVSGPLEVHGDIRAGNSALYFTATGHQHTGLGNTAGYAAIENDGAEHNALMIIGRTVSRNPLRRVVKLWDYLQVNGTLEIHGHLSKSSGQFKIDHPLEPAKKYLQHSFVESPDMMNIYNGNVQLDESGKGTVVLPAWFQALNRDFRYQLTCIGECAPVYIAAEVNENRFAIAGGKPGGRVSWQVTGMRKDPWAMDHPIAVEIEKSEGERGTYLYPEGYGSRNGRHPGSSDAALRRS